VNTPAEIPAAAREPSAVREDRGHVAIRDYAAIGDGRTVALVARDGSIEWLCLPDLDSPSVFASLLDPEQGGRFQLTPVEPYAVERRYVPHTNALETTFETASGTARVTDAMLLPTSGLAPTRELVRRIEGLSGSVAMRWSVEPRFDYGRARTRIARRGEVPVATAGGDALAMCSWGAGEPRHGGETVWAGFTTEAGRESLIDLAAAHGDALVFPAREEVERRLRDTLEFWRNWAARREYAGPWREAVVRNALALKLLIFAPSGAIAAAATTSLPETIGGERNWDYRFSWVRDSSATLDALLRLGCPAEVEAFFWWLLHASQLTHPRLDVLYRLNGRAGVREQTLSLEGYRCSSPVRIGNLAAEQLQLDVYGHLLQTAWLYCRAGGTLDADTGRRLAATADLVCRIWSSPDSGIWEVRSHPRHFTESKMMCWIALDRAARLATQGHIPDRNAERWRREAGKIARFVAERCWSPRRRRYLRFPEAEEVDAALLLPAMLGYGDEAERERFVATVDSVRADLGEGALLRRYRGEDGLRGEEGAFLTCSFWLVDALARLGRVEEAAATMEDLLPLANDVGLYAEEIDPQGGEFLGNFPQGLVHLALVNAAISVAEAAR
jgi:GH15 family glucan-1,4-alpha-glucosidase